MALNTPKRLKTTVPHHNYLCTPPPPQSVGLGIGSPPVQADSQTNGAYDGALMVPSTTAVGQQHQQHQWSSSSWLSETTSPSSSCGSPDGLLNRSFGGNTSIGTPRTWSSSGGSAEKSENKRGRPRSEALTTLMVEGSSSPSAIKCRFCNRVFPREKSLQAHLRTHTGERPYQCDYPGCTRAFTQSGQLKTHQRLHTGERPFICARTDCQMRFTHANRHCPDHPYETLRRCDDFFIQTLPEQSGDVLRWLEKYRAEREDRTPTRKTPKRGNGAENGSAEGSVHHLQNENENRRPASMQRPPDNDENYHEPYGAAVGGGAGGGAAGTGAVGGAVGLGFGTDRNGLLLQSPITPNNTYKSSRKGLMCELDMNAGLGLSSSPVTTKAKTTLPKLIQWQEPIQGQEEDESGDEACAPLAQSNFNPKKKWLREAGWQDDLAKPLEPSVISQKAFASTTSTMALKQQLHQESSKAASPLKKFAGQQPTSGRQPLPRSSMGSSVNGLPVPGIASLTPIDPNQMRPTVLMVASKDCARPLCDQPAALLTNGHQQRVSGSPKPEENNRKLQGALALMALATEDAHQLGTSLPEDDLLTGDTMRYAYAISTQAAGGHGVQFNTDPVANGHHEECFP
ncbi:uncharacterized protein LOC128278609 [Anopheles cruzii]|uniref:uncharacterized protein LOC128278609 n=1 Tax=Anopheles cruzii TaxID=68878 RepID=UPI0022EC342D|nr:uncharacterized protein LOC128278609 [Anopheles cruzii]